MVISIKSKVGPLTLVCLTANRRLARATHIVPIAVSTGINASIIKSTFTFPFINLVTAFIKGLLMLYKKRKKLRKTNREISIWIPN